jgi:hypothetical protein
MCSMPIGLMWLLGVSAALCIIALSCVIAAYAVRLIDDHTGK